MAAARRPLVDGLKTEDPIDPDLAREFIYKGAPKTEPPAKPHPIPTANEAGTGKGRADNSVGRVPLTIRFRADYAAALKRASLQRQLDGVSPNSLQDILEEALEPWLRNNGYVQ